MRPGYKFCAAKHTYYISAEGGLWIDKLSHSWTACSHDSGSKGLTQRKTEARSESRVVDDGGPKSVVGSSEGNVTIILFEEDS